MRAESADLQRRSPVMRAEAAPAANRAERRFDQPRDHEIRRQLRALREFGG